MTILLKMKYNNGSNTINVPRQYCVTVPG